MHGWDLETKESDILRKERCPDPADAIEDALWTFIGPGFYPASSSGLQGAPLWFWNNQNSKWINPKLLQWWGHLPVHSQCCTWHTVERGVDTANRLFLRRGGPVLRILTSHKGNPCVYSEHFRKYLCRFLAFCIQGTHYTHSQRSQSLPISLQLWVGVWMGQKHFHYSHGDVEGPPKGENTHIPSLVLIWPLKSGPLTVLCGTEKQKARAYRSLHICSTHIPVYLQTHLSLLAQGCLVCP